MSRNLPKGSARNKSHILLALRPGFGVALRAHTARVCLPFGRLEAGSNCCAICTIYFLPNPTLEQRTVLPVAPVHSVREPGAEVAHRLRRSAPHRADQQMMVVGYEGEGVHFQPELVNGLRHQVEEHQAVVVLLLQDRRATAATVRRVKPRASTVGSGFSCHRPASCVARGVCQVGRLMPRSTVVRQSTLLRQLGTDQSGTPRLTRASTPAASNAVGSGWVKQTRPLHGFVRYSRPRPTAGGGGGYRRRLRQGTINRPSSSTHAMLGWLRSPTRQLQDSSGGLASS